MKKDVEAIIDEIIVRSGIEGGSPSMSRYLAQQLVDRPAALAATRVIGFTDSALARVLGVTAMSVNDWTRGRKAIPPVRHAAIVLFVSALCRFMDELMDHPGDSESALRARALREAAMKLTNIAKEEGALDGDGAAAHDLAVSMLTKIAGIDLGRSAS